MAQTLRWIAAKVSGFPSIDQRGVVMSGFFMDWDGNLRSVDDPGEGFVCEVDTAARYVGVMKGSMLEHESTLYKTLEDVEKAGIKATLVPGSHPWGNERDGL